MDLMSLLVRIGADTSGVEQGIKKTQTLGQKLSKSLKTASKVGAAAIAGATTAVIAFTKSSVDVGKQFDASMSQVAATMGKTTDEIDDLRKFAQKMGRETAFSATQAADALNYMALAGYDSETAMKMLPNVLNLAAAGSIDLASASDMVTDAQSALGLTLDETTEMVDKMAKTSSKSNTSVAQLGEAFLTVGGTAKDLAGGTTELSTVLGILADNGIKGSEGGTALRNIILALEAPTDKAAEAMKELGLQVFDANGNMRPMEEIFGDLNERLATMNQGERTQVLNEIFNKVDLKSVNALLATNVDRWDELTVAIDDSTGAAQAMADVQLDNLEGDITLFKSALEGAQIALSDVLTPSLREFVKFGTEAVSELTKAFEEDGLNGAMKALGNIISDGIGLIIKGLPGFVDAGIQLLGAIIQGIMDNFPALIEAAGQIAETIISNIMSYVEEKNPQLAEVLNKIGGAVKEVYEAIKGFWTDTLQPALQQMWTWITEDLIPSIQSAWELLQPKVQAVFDALKGFWTETLEPIYQSMKKWIEEDLIPKFKGAWEDARDKVDDVFNGLVTLWNEVLKPIYEGIKTFLEETLQPAFENVFGAISTTVDNDLSAIKRLWEESVKPIYEGILEFFNGVFSGDFETAWNGIQKIVEGVWNAIQIAAETAWNNAKTWATTIVANFTLAFTNAWNLVKDSVVGLWDGIKDKAEELWNGAKEWGAAIIANFYTSVTNAWNLIKSTILGLWDDITNKVTEIWEAAQKWGGNIIGNFWVSINDAWTIAIDKVKGLFQQIPDAIKDIVDSALNWGKDMIQNFVDGITEKWEALKDKVMAVPNKIRSWLHFSVPDEGPLSDFDTYAPDMIELFANGIVECAHLITTALVNLLNNIKTIFKLAGEGAYKEFNTALNGDKGDQFINAIKNPLENAANAISRINWSNIGYKIYTDVTRYTSDIYDKFRNAFDFSRIYVKTPHWWVDSWSEISGTYYPNMSVHWYKKAYQNPVMFNRPTVMPTLNGYMGFGDGSGGEVVLSEAKLKDIVGERGGDVTNNNTFNIYQRDGENMEQLARRIEDILTRQQNQRKAAFA